MDELPSDYIGISEPDQKKAKVFFDRGNTVAGTGNYDYAIEMYLNGLGLDPESVSAHQTLRDISMKRKASGGKGTGFMDAMKLKRPTKDDKQNMLNNEKLLSYEPGSTDYMVGVLQNAVRAGYYQTVMWIGPILQQANADSGKPDWQKFIVLRDAYKTYERWQLAANACQYATLLRPDDMDLQRELKDLGAKHTIEKGNYQKKGGTFTDSIKDRETQDRLNKQDSGVQEMSQMASLIKHAETEWKADPNDPGKIGKYTDVLVKTEQADLENKAIDILQNAFDRSKQFRFRLKIGQIRIGQLSRMERNLRAKVNANPQDQEAIQEYKQFTVVKVQEELAEYQLAVENYPTDSKLKYEVAIRLLALRRYDEAIPYFQQLRNDPKYKIDGSIQLGQAFLEAGFTDEAIDTLAAVISDYPGKGDAKSINMTYMYGRALEIKKEIPSALKAYSQVAQWNFTFKDTQARIKKLKIDLQGGSSDKPA